MSEDRYASGDWNAICDRCGKQFKFSRLKKTWDGLWVCSRDWEPRHPQDFVRGIKDDQHAPVTRPDAPDTFVAGAEALVVPPFTFD